MTPTDNETARIIVGTLAEQFARESHLYVNLGHETLIIDATRLELCLTNNLAKMERGKDWQAPAGVLLTIVGTFVTTDFKNFGLKAEVWQALFLLVGMAATYFLGKGLRAWWTSPKLADILKELKAASAKGEDAAKK